MPELRFVIRWPDGSRDSCYSPSTVVREHFTANTSYPLPAFLEHSRSALLAASERVRLRYGSPCVHAMRQLAAIEAKTEQFAATPDAAVHFETFEE